MVEFRVNIPMAWQILIFWWDPAIIAKQYGDKGTYRNGQLVTGKSYK